MNRIEVVLESLDILEGGNLVSGSNAKGLIKIWDLTTGLFQELAGKAGCIRCLGLIARVSDNENSIQIWEPTTGVLVRKIEGHTGIISHLAVLKDGRIVSGDSDGFIKVWIPHTESYNQDIIYYFLLNKL